MSNQIFADALGGILVTAGTVRLDFVTISPLATDGQAKLELGQRVIMPVEAFLRAAVKIQEAVQAMSKPQPGEAEKAPSPQAPQAPRAHDAKVPFP